jgi:hypothetical protein
VKAHEPGIDVYASDGVAEGRQLYWSRQAPPPQQQGQQLIGSVGREELQQARGSR